MSITIGIIAHTATDHLLKITNEAIRSYSGADEVIVVENGCDSKYDCDTYIRFKNNEGFTRAANAILRNATKDYVAVVNNDTYLVSGKLQDLCISETITCPVPTITAPEGFRGSFFVIPRDIIPAIGVLDEELKHFESDVEFSNRIRSLGIPFKQINSVVFFHYGDLTRQQTKDIPDWSIDSKIYQEKYRDNHHHTGSR